MATSINLRKELKIKGFEPQKEKYPKFQPNKLLPWPISRPKLLLKTKKGRHPNTLQFEVTNIGRSLSARTIVSVYTNTNLLSLLKTFHIGTIMPGETRQSEEVSYSDLKRGIPLIVMAEDPLTDRISGSLLLKSLIHANLLDVPANRSASPANENRLSTDPSNKWTEYKYNSSGLNASTGLLAERNELKWKGRISTYPNDPNDPILNDGIRLYFFAENSPEKISEIRQGFTITELQSANPVNEIDSHLFNEDLYAEFSAYSASYKQSPRDKCRMLIDIYNANNGLLQNNYLELSPGSKWQKNTIEFLLPKATSRIQIRLQSIKNTGTNNDGYFSNVSLVVRHRQVESEFIND